MAHALRLRGPLAADPAAQMFHILLVVVGIWMAIGLITLPLAPITLYRLLLALPGYLPIIAALIVLRLGYYRGASLIYLVGTWIAVTAQANSLGGIRSHLISYGTLP